MPPLSRQAPTNCEHKMIKHLKFSSSVCAFALSVVSACVAPQSAAAAGEDWHYNGGPNGDHYATLAQIDPANVGRLKEVWRFDLEDGGIQAQPLVIDGTLYGPTPSGKLVALNAATGALKWTFDSGLAGGQPIRGLTSHGSGRELRLLFATQNQLIALDPATGKPITSFGREGRVDVNENLRGSSDKNAMFVTTPGTVFEDLYIFSGRVSESTPASPGDIRAIDVNTGEFRWVFHTIPHPGETGVETWPKDAHLTQGGANGWAGSALDVERGIIYFTTGSAADDFYGAERLGSNRFANSLIALDARTGKRLWDFQAVRHDIWDMDFNSAPVLLTVSRNGRKIDAVAATNKLSYVYLFDRVTGAPLFPIDEVKVPPSRVPGEVAARTQPVPRLPRPLSRVAVTPDDLTTRTPAANDWALGVYAALNGGGKQFAPMAIGKETLVFAGFIGGAGWGGMAADRAGVLYANATDIPGISSIVESKDLLTSGVGEGAYRTQCANCHGADRKGIAEVFPSLVDIKARLSDTEIVNVVKNGRGRMPGFSTLPATTIANVVAFLTTGEDLPGTARPAISLQGRFAPSKTLYTSTGNRNFVDADGYPAVKPPWGTLNAIDMNTGQYLWRIPFGVTGTLGPEFGGANTGGAVVTASGLLFIGATADKKFHAFDARSGKLLWETTLGAPAQATPATYQINGKQFVVIASGARRAGAQARNQDNSQAVTTNSSAGGYVAFALPD